jgi:hypothetical protein
MYKIQHYIKECTIQFSNENDDGRINSCIDEKKIIEFLSFKFYDRIIKPKIRMWYDILVFDYMYGWIPVNIKTTTTMTCDNTGNLAMCVYTYTNESLDIHKSYTNGKMSDLLIHKIKTKQYNKNSKKDYYFLVLNKKNPSDVIVNSVKGIKILTSNINNLPFQVCWNNNRYFEYKCIEKCISDFLVCLKKPQQNWKEIFMTDIRKIKL